MDIIAVGQFTPGPISSSTTFIGWQLNGIWGAFEATLGILPPSFVFVALLNPMLKRIRKPPFISAF